MGMITFDSHLVKCEDWGLIGVRWLCVCVCYKVGFDVGIECWNNVGMVNCLPCVLVMSDLLGIRTVWCMEMNGCCGWLGGLSDGVMLVRSGFCMVKSLSASCVGGYGPNKRAFFVWLHLDEVIVRCLEV